MLGMTRPATIAALAASLSLVVIKLLFEHYPGEFTAKGQAEAFTGPLVVGVILIGMLGLLAERSLSADGRFPEPFTDGTHERRALQIAAATGATYGLITLGRDLASLGSRNPVSLTEWAHVPWPWSVPFYTFGGIFFEFLLRLGALCILVWLIHVVLLRRRWLMPTFWAVNVVVASYEIQPSVLESVAAEDWRSVALAPLEPLDRTNVFEGWLLLRYGGSHRSSSGSPSIWSCT